MNITTSTIGGWIKINQLTSLNRNSKMRWDAHFFSTYPYLTIFLCSASHLDFKTFKDEDDYLEEQLEIEREKNQKQERITGGY